MHEENNELNDIILNRNEQHHARKKMLIGIAALAIVLIVIVIIMGRISSSTPTQLPQPMLPTETVQNEPVLPEEQNASADEALLDDQLNAVAEKLKEEMPPVQEPAKEEEIVVVDDAAAEAKSSAAAVAPAQKSPPTAEAAREPAASAATSGAVYIQVGSFSRYKPDPKFLTLIKRSGYDYTFHRVVIDGQIKNKVLVGPFRDRSDAKRNLTNVRKKIESGAFIYTIK